MVSDHSSLLWEYRRNVDALSPRRSEEACTGIFRLLSVTFRFAFSRVFSGGWYALTVVTFRTNVARIDQGCLACICLE